MAHYAIGDIQGCFVEFQYLLQKINFQHGKDTLWLAGDIVNRGPASLKVLEYVYQHQNSIQIVLGNHDLHLLAVAFAGASQKKGDTMTPILESVHANKLLDWLRHQPLLVHDNEHIMVHAGLYPTWDLATAQSFANEVENALQSRHFSTVLKEMYGNKPKKMKDDMTPIERIRFAINVMTRMRALEADHSLEFDYKKNLENMPGYLHAWFEDTLKVELEKDIIFGHWSALGLYQNHSKRIYGLDTGAVWNGHLTAMNLETKEIIQVPSSNGLPINAI